jgi:YjbE family integral membrane protein
MELFSAQFFSALFAIIVIDLVLAGDNAIVIALAARRLPPHLQLKAVVWGTVGAIVVRVITTLAIVALLKIPGLRLAGGLLLIWIAYKLLAGDDAAHDGPRNGAQTVSFWSALRTIIIADTVMGLDNVLGVAGAAHGSFLLVVLGLLISIPIMVWGSTLVLRVIDRFPAIIYLGAGVLAWTAGGMIVDEPLAQDFLAGASFLGLTWMEWTVYLAVVGGVLLGGWIYKRGAALHRSEKEKFAKMPPQKGEIAGSAIDASQPSKSSSERKS